MSTPAGGGDSLAKCLAFCQALASQGQVFNFSVSIGSDFNFSLDTRSKAVKTLETRKKASPSTLRRNARRRAEFIAGKQEISPSRISSDGKTVNSSTLLACTQCDYKAASEKGLKQHMRMKHKKPSGPLATPESLRTETEFSRSPTSSPLLNIREENCRNCEGPFFPGHQCGDVEEVTDASSVETVQCDFCGVAFYCEDELENHKAATCLKRFNCKACNVNCLDLGEIWRHNSIFHKSSV